MLITLHSIKGLCSPPLLEVHQDNYFKLLSEHPDGLISRYHSICYSIIVKSEKDVAMAHILAIDHNSDDLVNNMINAVSNNSQTSRIIIYLARSPYTYDANVEQHRHECTLNKIPFAADDSAHYFSKEDEIYTDFFQRNFGLFKLELLDMPNDFIVIDSKSKIQLFSDYKPHDILYHCDSDEHDEYLPWSESSSPTITSKMSDDIGSEIDLAQSIIQPSASSFSFFGVKRASDDRFGSIARAASMSCVYPSTNSLQNYSQNNAITTGAFTLCN